MCTFYEQYTRFGNTITFFLQQKLLKENDMKRSLLALALTAIATSSFAYDAQIDGGFTYFDFDSNAIDTAGQLDTKATFYFAPVQTKNSPLNEAAFLGHNSNAYGKYTYNYLNSEPFYDFDGKNTTEVDVHQIAGGLEYFYEQFYVNGEIGFGQSKTEVTVGGNKFKSDDDVTTYRALVGFMPITNLLLAVGVDGYQGDGDDDANNFALKAKYVTPIGQAGQYLNLEADGSLGDVDNMTIGADYYLNKTFSLGAAYNIQDDGDDNIDSFLIRTKYFLNDAFAVGGAIGFGDDIQTYNVNATFRF